MERDSLSDQPEVVAASYLESQLRELYARIVYTHKTQEKCADIAYVWLHRLKLWQIVLSAITTTGLLFTIVTDIYWALVISTAASTVLLVLNSYLKEYDLGTVAEKHSAAASNVLELREECLSLITDLVSDNFNLEELRSRRDDFVRRLAEVYRGNPRSNSRAYSEARRSLQEIEEFTFSDDEIDKFLPGKLRKQNRSST